MGYLRYTFSKMRFKNVILIFDVKIDSILILVLIFDLKFTLILFLITNCIVSAQRQVIAGRS